MTDRPVILAGVPTQNLSIYRRTRFAVGDTVVFIELPGEGTFLILRNIEMDRARKAGAADHIHAPADFAPAGGLSGDRDTANAQAAAELLKKHGVSEIWTDRALPMLFTHMLTESGVVVRCDPEMGVLERRAKDEHEVEHLRKAQRMTEDVVSMACRLIGAASVGERGELRSAGEPLTSEFVRAQINIFLLHHGMDTCNSVVAGGPQGADCHDRGSGPLRTGEPIIIDVFPRDPVSLYCGDCTRTVVHGRKQDIPDPVVRMHRAVVEAKQAAISATRAGVTGEAVHEAACAVIREHGYEIGLPPKGAPDGYTGFVHGTGHGVGLDVHEPPLLDAGGPELVVGDALTIEPGLYGRAVGGIRVEDMVIVREDGCENLNTIPEGLTWE
ncbi:MAG: aminopeptidase P family protein [Phycisphaeraceae bacterium]|nr:MAG: aminopeptidase P family protein [Phycisphaeraceae bacterium]